MQTENKQHALKGRASNRSLPEEERASSSIFIRCHRKEKASWVKSAQKENMNLSEWVKKTLNNHSKCIDK